MNLTDELAWATMRDREEQIRPNHSDTSRASYQERVDEPAVDADQVVFVRDLRKTYAGGIEALKGISFEVREGEIFGMLGPNGAGKTTTIGILTTTVRPSSGAATVAATTVPREPLAVRQAIGVTFQESVLDNDFSGIDNLRLHARLWRMSPREAEDRITSL